MGGAYQLSTRGEWLRQFWNCFLSISSRKSRVNGRRKRIIPHCFCEFIEKGFLLSPPSISQYCSQNSFNPHAGMHARIVESLSCLPSEFSFSSALTRHHKQTTSIPLQPHFSSIKFYFAFILCLRNFSDYTKIENISSAFTSNVVLLQLLPIYELQLRDETIIAIQFTIYFDCKNLNLESLMKNLILINLWLSQ